MNKTVKLYSSIALLILSGIYLSAIFFGKLDLESIAPVVSFIAFLLLLLSARGWKDILVPGIVYALLFAVTKSMAISTAWICIYASIILGAYIITVGDKIQILMVAMTAPMVYFTSLDLTGNAVISLASLIPYPAMLCLGFCTRRFVNRKNAIIYTSVCLGASTALGIFILSVKHSVGIESIKSSIGWIKEFVIKYMSEYTVKTAEGDMNLFVDQAYITEYIDGLVNILPGTLIVLLVSLAFALQIFLFSSLKKERLIEYMTSDVTEFQVSGLCAGIYLTALVLSFTTNSEGKIMLGSAIMQNIYLALTPALVYVAAKSIKNYFKKIKVRPGIILTIPAALLLYNGLLSVTMAILGVTVIIVSKAKKYADDPKGKENGK